MDDAFATRNYDIIFPNGVCDEVHYDKFKRELRVGDERYLYDNSVDDKNPKLVTNDTIDSNSKPVVEKLDTSKLKSDGTDGDETQKTRERMTSRMTVKKLCRNLNIYQEELAELRRDLDMLSEAQLPVGDLGAQLSEGEQLAKMSMAVLKRQGSRFVKDEHKSQEWHAKQKEVDAEVQKVISTMKKLAEQEEYALAQNALTTILKWLDDPEPDIRHLRRDSS